MKPNDFLVEERQGPLRIRWLGTAGFELTAEGTVLLIDPYLTRAGLWRVLKGPLTPNQELIDRSISKADAVLVGHSHFDHVMDVPSIAKKTGARVYGSPSTAHLCQAAGVPEDRITACRGGETFEVGPFRVTTVPSLHSPFALRRTVPYAGDIPCTCELPLRVSGYRCGDVLSFVIEVAGKRLYHLGSANLVDDAIPVRDVDLAMVTIIARHATPDFLGRAMKRLTPRAVIPIHYDNFFRPIGAELKSLPMTRFGRFVDDVQGFDKQIEVWTLGLCGQTHL
jgi:L-ascorbate metabolism protein UlaG (beta-lactamase superfamily)